MRANDQDNDTEGSTGTPSFRPGLPTFDAEEFRDFIDKIDATEKEKLEYLQLLWRIAITFVDISFGVDSTQQAISSTRKIGCTQEHDSPQESHQVDLENHPQQFNRAAMDKAARKGKS